MTRPSTTTADEEADWLHSPITVAEMIEAAEAEAARVRAIQSAMRDARALRGAPADQRRRLAVHMATARLLRRIGPHMALINAMLKRGESRVCGTATKPSIWTGSRRTSRRRV